MEDSQIQQPQPNNPIEPMQSFLHRWLPTIVGIAIVVFIGGGVLAWQYFGTGGGKEIAQDETAHWQTYENEEFGLEIKYPIGTKIGDIDITGGREVRMQLPFFPGETKLTGKVLHIRIVTTQFNRGVEQPATCTKAADTQYIVTNGISFSKNNISDQFGGTQVASVAIEYCTMKGNKAFKIVYELAYSRYSELPNFSIEKESEVFERMLSTFRFLE